MRNRFIIKLNEEFEAKIIKYNKGDRINCNFILCDIKENIENGFVGCRMCNINKIQEKNDNFKYITYEEAIENNLIIEVEK